MKLKPSQSTVRNSLLSSWPGSCTLYLVKEAPGVAVAQAQAQAPHPALAEATRSCPTCCTSTSVLSSELCSGSSHFTESLPLSEILSLLVHKYFPCRIPRSSDPPAHSLLVSEAGKALPPHILPPATVAAPHSSLLPWSLSPNSSEDRARRLIPPESATGWTGSMSCAWICLNKVRQATKVSEVSCGGDLP